MMSNEEQEAKVGKERRRHKRYDVKLHADVTTDDAFLFAYVSNISEMGIFLASDDPKPIGTQLKLRFKPIEAGEAFDCVLDLVNFGDGAADLPAGKGGGGDDGEGCKGAFEGVDAHRDEADAALGPGGGGGAGVCGVRSSGHGDVAVAEDLIERHAFVEFRAMMVLVYADKRGAIDERSDLRVHSLHPYRDRFA